MKYFILSAVLVLEYAVARDLRNNEYTQFYQSLEEDLKTPFLQYQLAEGVLLDDEVENIKISPIDKSFQSANGLGIPEDIYERVENLSPPNGFTEHLYEIAKEDLRLTKSQIMELASKGQICFDRKTCVDIGDIGSNCC